MQDILVKTNSLLEKISVVVPTFNSSEWIISFLVELSSFLDSHYPNHELLIVNDGSGDNTLALVTDFASANSSVSIIDLKNRKGQQNATWLGIAKSSGKVVITIDDDGEFPPNQIRRLFDTLNDTQADLVYGIPIQMRSRGINIFFYHWYLKNLQRKGEHRKSSFRLITRKLLAKLLPSIDSPMNIDIYLAAFNPKIEYTDIEYLPGDRGRYGLLGYALALLNIMVYKRKIRKNKSGKIF